MVDEPLGMSCVSNIQDVLALCHDVRSLPVMNHGRRQQAEAGMTMLLVVPKEKLLAEGAAVLQRTKPVRKFRPVL